MTKSIICFLLSCITGLIGLSAIFYMCFNDFPVLINVLVIIGILIMFILSYKYFMIYFNEETLEWTKQEDFE